MNTGIIRGAAKMYKYRKVEIRKSEPQKIDKLIVQLFSERRRKKVIAALTKMNTDIILGAANNVQIEGG